VKPLKPRKIGPISPDMRTKVRPARAVIASYVEPRTFAPGTRAALQGLGYAVVPALCFGRFDVPRTGRFDAPGRGRGDEPAEAAAIRLVDERHADRIPGADQDPDTPIVLVSGRRRPRIDDPRIAGVVTRPVDLDTLYPILQRALEATPRRVPRVPIQLSARAMRADRRWAGSLTSLSVGGCYLRSSRRVPLGTPLCVQFALPHNGVLTTRAVCVHADDEGTGLAFTDASDVARREIGGYVAERLAALRR